MPQLHTNEKWDGYWFDIVRGLALDQFTVEELVEMPTLATGQADDLKIEDLDRMYRVWISRCEEDKITIELFDSFAKKWGIKVWYYGG